MLILLVSLFLSPWIIWYGIGLKEFPWWFFLIDIGLAFLMGRVVAQMYDIIADTQDAPSESDSLIETVVTTDNA